MLFSSDVERDYDWLVEDSICVMAAFVTTYCWVERHGGRLCMDCDSERQVTERITINRKPPN